MCASSGDSSEKELRRYKDVVLTPLPEETVL